MDTVRDARAQDAVDTHGHWYHTLELGDGVVTPGWFDLRPILHHLPIPDVRGKRCLDVGPYDGFFAFELERRGASEVVAVDIGDHAGWDWPFAARAQGPDALREMVGVEVGAGFELAKRLLGSSVKRVEMSVYDLDPEVLGQFDVVVCGSLMLHLRDPVRALEAIRSVTREWFLSAETISLEMTLRAPRRPAAEFKGGEVCQWWIPNRAAHRLMLVSAGFDVVRRTKTYAIPFGAGHLWVGRAKPFQRDILLQRLLAGGPGVPHSAILSRPSAISP